MVVASVRVPLIGQSAHAADVSGYFPNLTVLDLAAERRHSVGSTLANRCINLVRFAPVNPLAIDQRRTHPSAAVGVTTDAVECLVELFAFGHRPRIVVPPGLYLSKIAARRHFHVVSGSFRIGRGRLVHNRALLLFAAREQEQEEEERIRKAGKQQASGVFSCFPAFLIDDVSARKITATVAALPCISLVPARSVHCAEVSCESRARRGTL